MRGIEGILWWLLNLVFRIMVPWYWLQNEPTNWSYDSKLRKDMKDHEVKYLDEYTIRLGDEIIWVENYPYQFGYLYGRNRDLPSPLTRFKLKRMVNKLNTDPWGSK